MLDREDAGEAESCRRNPRALSASKSTQHVTRSTRDPRDADRARENAPDQPLFGLLRGRALARGCETRASCPRGRCPRLFRAIRTTRERTGKRYERSLRLSRNNI